MIARPIIFGPGDKLRWMEAVAFHPLATAFHARLAIALSNRIDKHLGTATIGQQWLAAAVHATERGVRKALLEMEGCQLLVATRPAVGRGKATVYRPLTPMREPRNGGSAFSNETRNGGSGERRNAETQKAERGLRKGGTAVPILPNTHLNNSPSPTNWRQSKDAFRVAFGQLAARLDDRTGETGGIIIGVNSASVTWQSVKGKLRAALGAATVEAWFDRLEVEDLTATEVVMTCPSKFVRHYIEQHFLNEGLLAGWRRVLPNINTVRLVDARAEAAE